MATVVVKSTGASGKYRDWSKIQKNNSKGNTTKKFQEGQVTSTVYVTSGGKLIGTEGKVIREENRAMDEAIVKQEAEKKRILEEGGGFSALIDPTTNQPTTDVSKGVPGFGQASTVTSKSYNYNYQKAGLDKSTTSYDPAVDFVRENVKRVETPTQANILFLTQPNPRKQEQDMSPKRPEFKSTYITYGTSGGVFSPDLYRNIIQYQNLESPSQVQRKREFQQLQQQQEFNALYPTTTDITKLTAPSTISAYSPTEKVVTEAKTFYRGFRNPYGDATQTDIMAYKGGAMVYQTGKTTAEIVLTVYGGSAIKGSKYLASATKYLDKVPLVNRAFQSKSVIGRSVTGLVVKGGAFYGANVAINEAADVFRPKFNINDEKVNEIYGYSLATSESRSVKESPFNIGGFFGNLDPRQFTIFGGPLGSIDTQQFKENIYYQSREAGLSPYESFALTTQLNRERRVFARSGYQLQLLGEMSSEIIGRGNAMIRYSKKAYFRSGKKAFIKTAVTGAYITAGAGATEGAAQTINYYGMYRQRATLKEIGTGAALGSVVAGTLGGPAIALQTRSAVPRAIIGKGINKLYDTTLNIVDIGEKPGDLFADYTESIYRKYTGKEMSGYLNIKIRTTTINNVPRGRSFSISSTTKNAPMSLTSNTLVTSKNSIYETGFTTTSRSTINTLTKTPSIASRTRSLVNTKINTISDNFVKTFIPSRITTTSKTTNPTTTKTTTTVSTTIPTSVPVIVPRGSVPIILPWMAQGKSKPVGKRKKIKPSYTKSFYQLVTGIDGAKPLKVKRGGYLGLEAIRTR